MLFVDLVNIIVVREWRNWQTRTFEGRVGNRTCSSPVSRTIFIAGLCKGSTADSDSVCLGSNPSPAAKIRVQNRCTLFWTHFYSDFKHLWGTPFEKWLDRCFKKETLTYATFVKFKTKPDQRSLVTNFVRVARVYYILSWKS